MFLPRPSTLYLCPLQIMCLTRYIDGESLRNGMFTICQIGFIGTVIQWWSLMQWYSVKWILPYYGHSSAVIYVISPRPHFKPQGFGVHRLQTFPFLYPDVPVLFGQPHAGIVPVHVNNFDTPWHGIQGLDWPPQILFSSANSVSISAFTCVGIRYHYAMEYIQTG